MMDIQQTNFIARHFVRFARSMTFGSMPCPVSRTAMRTDYRTLQR